MTNVKKADKYKHFKGAIYEYVGLSIPLLAEGCQIKADDLIVIGEAKEESTLSMIKLYDFAREEKGSGLLFTESDIPYVIYRHVGEKEAGSYNGLWARRVDDFHGYKEDNGTFVKRFVLQTN